MPMPCTFKVEQLRPFRALEHDFPMMLRDLSSKRISLSLVARLCGRATNTVNSWKNDGVVPRHADGETILALHRHFCGDRKQPARTAEGDPLAGVMSRRAE